MKVRIFGRVRLLTLGLAAAFGLAAGAAVLELTEPPGPGLDPDAMQYLSAAQAIANGDGLRIPFALWDNPDTTSTLSHFPPGYSTAVAVGITAGFTPQNAARLVMAMGAGVTAAAMIFTAVEGGTLLGGVLAVFILAVTSAMVIVHGSVLSEPLFLALFTCFVWQLTRPREARGRTVALGVLAAAAALVRYAGVSLVGAVLLDAWLGDAWLAGAADRERPTLIARARRTAVALVIPVAALGCWSLLKPRGGEIRKIAWYGRGLGDTLAQGATTLGQWLAPSEDLARGGAVLAVLVMLAMVALIVRDLRAVWAGAAAGAPHLVRAQRQQRALGIAKVCYLGLVAASRLFADGDIPLDERILAPLFVIGALAIGAALVRWWFAAGRGVMLFTMGIMASWMVGSVQQSRWWVAQYREDGGDFAGRDWQLSPLIAYAAQLPSGAQLYSNWPSAIWFHTRRASRAIPEVLTPKIAAEFAAKMTKEHGMLLSFTVVAADLAHPDSLAKAAGLVPVLRLADGVVWRVPGDTAGIPATVAHAAAAPVPARSGAARPTRPQ